MKRREPGSITRPISLATPARRGASGRSAALTALALAIVLLAAGWARSLAAQDPDPHTQPDATWITISGTVGTVMADAFTLDYGDGLVTVEMDDGDRDADAYKLMLGDEVIVTGKIDDDMFETTSIEAASVYVENLGTTFFSDVVDEQYREVIDSVNVPPIQVGRTILRGRVTEVNLEDFMIDTGNRRVRVDTTQLPYDPLDAEGYQKIAVGDRVQVIGQIDVSLFEGRELMADNVIKLYEG